ncbi:MAG: alanine--tRNA ligase, partial [Verrucomicrobia bacterium]|nr:alanine--tRNA ligase [Verrucomicrobiota bacterium]
GMGFERLVAVLQGKRSNYETDVFTPLLKRIEEISGCRYEGEDAVAMRVISDHIRTLSIAIADGVMPSNDGRGYVLRRLLRRAVRYSRQLGLREPFMSQLVPVVVQTLGGVFSELAANQESIMRAVNAEEESFASTLDRGIALFEEVVEGLTQRRETIFPGDQAFKLYDTFGFPLDLTILMAGEQKLTVDEQVFADLMEEQRSRARSARKDAILAQDADLVSDLISEEMKSVFVGYGALEHETNIIAAILKGKRTDSLAETDEGVVILAETPFYSESGGQVGDKGTIRGPSGEFEVWDTQRPAEGIVMHVGKVVQGSLNIGDRVAATVDHPRRGRLIRHHTATHLLNAALHKHVSGTIKQAGSFVAPDRLRFDFTHYEAIPTSVLEQIEKSVNGWIMDNAKVTTYEMPLKDVQGSGIVAVFDEKYGDVVRVVDVNGVSRELCGGTHVSETGEIGQFRIVSESSVASGIRRIEAVCGWPAYEWTQREHDLVRSLAHRFSAPAEELMDRIETLIEQNRKLEKKLKEQAQDAAKGAAEGLTDKVQEIGGVKVLAAVVEADSVDGLRQTMDALRPQMISGVIVLGAAAGGKAHFMASVSKDLIEKGLHAGKLVGAVAKIAGGGGGGRPDKAQAGGKDAKKVRAAIDAVPDMLSKLASS